MSIRRESPGHDLYNSQALQWNLRGGNTTITANILNMCHLGVARSENDVRFVQPSRSLVTGLETFQIPSL